MTSKEIKLIQGIINQETANKPSGDSVVLPNFSSAAGAELVNGKFNTAKVTGALTVGGTTTLGTANITTGNITTGVFTSATITGDSSGVDTIYIPNVLYNTDATPPAANTVPIGTIYIQYTP